MLDAWREHGAYTERERVALAWTEALTLVAEAGASDDAWEGVRSQFSDKELADLSLAIATINVWNRLNVGFRTPGGVYQPAPRTETASPG
jgi:alkylhydroperoxidase family enzyme